MIWCFMLSGKGMPCFPVFEDNQGAVQLTQNTITNSTSKHIDVRHHFLRELVRQRDINGAPFSYRIKNLIYMIFFVRQMGIKGI